MFYKYRMEKAQKNAKEYNCNICDFNTSKYNDYNRHLLTSKHKNRTELNKKTPKNSEKYNCKYCDKCYKVRNSLWYHEKKCILVQNKNDFLEKIENTNNNNNLITNLLKQNQDFQKQLLEIMKDNLCNITNNNIALL